jgi:hypothetical protein
MSHQRAGGLSTLEGKGGKAHAHWEYDFGGNYVGPAYATAELITVNAQLVANSQGSIGRRTPSSDFYYSYTVDIDNTDDAPALYWLHVGTF